MAGEERNLLEATGRPSSIRENLNREMESLELRREGCEARIRAINETLALLDKNPDLERLSDLTMANR